MGGDCVEWRKGGIIEDFDGAVALGDEQVWWRVCIGEGCLVRLLGLFVAIQDHGGGWDGGADGNKDIALIGRDCQICWRDSKDDIKSEGFPTFVPARSVLPSVLQLIVKGSPPTSSFATHVLLLVSQNRTVPSEEQLASSNSRTGLKRTFSTACPCPRSSVWLRGLVRSGFHMRTVLSLAPVAIRLPDAFHEIVRWLCGEQRVSA